MIIIIKTKINQENKSRKYIKKLNLKNFINNDN